jgi:hypothetical protein
MYLIKCYWCLSSHKQYSWAFWERKWVKFMAPMHRHSVFINAVHMGHSQKMSRFHSSHSWKWREILRHILNFNWNFNISRTLNYKLTLTRTITFLKINHEHQSTACKNPWWTYTCCLQKSLVLLIEKTLLFSNEFINILCNAKIEVQISKLCV